MSARSDRRWAELARELEFTQLPELRRQAEGWRNGLTALTGLLAVLVVLKGRDNLTGLPAWARYSAMTLIAVAFALLVTGSVLALRSAHGRPGAEIILGGQALRGWTEGEVRKVRRSLRAASFCCLSGITLVAGSVALAWVATSPPPTNMVRVDGHGVSVCGELVGAGPEGITVWTGSGDQRALRTINTSSVTSMVPVATC